MTQRHNSNFQKFLPIVQLGITGPPVDYIATVPKYRAAATTTHSPV